MAVPLAMRESDAGDELRRIAAETAMRKARARTSLGALNIGVVADRDVYPDLDVFVAGAREELDMLGVSTRPTPTTLK